MTVKPLDPKSLAELLASLGDTADEVADTLRARGIRGPSSSDACPVAHVIRQAWPDAFVFVAPRVVSICSHAGHGLLEEPPPPVLAFVERFDRGDYPDLVAGAS